MLEQWTDLEGDLLCRGLQRQRNLLARMVYTKVYLQYILSGRGRHVYQRVRSGGGVIQSATEASLRSCYALVYYIIQFMIMGDQTKQGSISGRI